MKKNVALIAGGYSGEYEISIMSGQQIAKHIDNERFITYLIIVTKDNWYYTDEENNRYEIDKNDFSLTIKGKKINFDVAYMIIHGVPGENGQLQGYLDLMGIPYTGCDMYASAVTFNKYYCKSIAASVGIPTSKSYFLTKDEYDVDAIIEKIGLPCFVKPNKNGSSVGITKVYEKDKLSEAIDNAFAADNEVLIENFVKGREFACGIFKKNGTNIVLPVTEIIAKNDFFDYEAKYTSGKSDEVTPADIDEETAATISAYTNLMYETLHCKGLVRVDFIATDEEVTFLELNAIPGMSAASIIPKQLGCYGIKMEELVNLLLDEALDSK